MFEEQSHPLHISARLWVNGIIIDPLKNRDVVAQSLSTSNKEIRFGVFRM